MADNKDKDKKLNGASAKPDEAKTAGTKTAETKPAETAKAAETTDSAAETKPAETKPAETKPAADPKKDDLLDDGMDLLDEERISVPLTPENAAFTRSKGGLISLELTHEDGTKEFFERVVILRAFPVSNPDEFLSVRDIPVHKTDRGHEIGMIRRMSDFDEATGRIFLEELDRRYFTPEITKINSVKEKFGYSYWDSQTTAGHTVFVLNNPFSNIRVLEDGRIFINDIDGNSLTIPDPKKLDPASFKKVEVYL